MLSPHRVVVQIEDNLGWNVGILECWNIDKIVKSQKTLVFVIPAPHRVRDKLQRESRKLKHLWTPAFAGVTFSGTFYEAVNLRSP